MWAHLAGPKVDDAIADHKGARVVVEAGRVVEVGGAGTLSRSVQAARIGGQVHLIGVGERWAGVDLSLVSETS